MWPFLDRAVQRTSSDSIHYFAKYVAEPGPIRSDALNVFQEACGPRLHNGSCPAMMLTWWKCCPLSEHLCSNAWCIQLAKQMRNSAMPLELPPAHVHGGSNHALHTNQVGIASSPSHRPPPTSFCCNIIERSIDVAGGLFEPAPFPRARYVLALIQICFVTLAPSSPNS